VSTGVKERIMSKTFGISTEPTAPAMATAIPP